MKYRAQKRGALFQTVPTRKIPKSGFPLSYLNCFTTDIGRLTPVMCQDVIPGDTFRLNDIMMVRFMPLLSPVMGRINCTLRYFFVPERLLWNKFQDFITGGPDGTLEPVKPQVALHDLDGAYKCGVKSLYDYLGGGSFTNCHGETTFDLGPFTAYNLIYQEYYRDQNLGEDLTDALEYVKSHEGEVDLEDEFGPDENKTLLTESFFDVRQKCWKKDYFTSALPWAQRGPAVTIPIGTSAPVTLNTQNVQFGLLNPSSPGFTWNVSDFSGNLGYFIHGTGINPATLFVGGSSEEPLSGSSLSTFRGLLKDDLGNNLKGVADLSSVTGITISDLRMLARTQSWYERNAVGGGRYVEQTLAHWDELIPDFTLQRPVYLGGATFPVQISEVLQTAQVSESGTTSSSAAGVGNMYGHGIGVSGKPGFKRMHFREHGWIIGLCSFMPDPSYFQGLARKFTRFDKFDYAWNELAHLGEQEILNQEIFISNSHQTDTFGYQSRYAEYKYNPDEIHGDFRNSLLYWTLARKFDNAPALNNDFMQVKSDVVNRIFAVQDGSFDHILCMLYHDMPASRKLPKYGTPGIHIL